VRGDYSGLGAAHRAVLDFCQARGRVPTGVKWEIYGHMDEDPAALPETEVYWLLR
jgi:hypothetical protein